MALTFSASYFDVLIDVLRTVRISVQTIELSFIDDALRREAVTIVDPRTDPYPKDQEAFNQFMVTAFENRGSDNTLDQWGTGLRWDHPSKEVYSITCAGPDKEFGTADDLVLKRNGQNREMTKNLDEIAKTMEEEIVKEKQRQEERLAKLEELNQILREYNLDPGVESLLDRLEQLQEEASRLEEASRAGTVQTGEPEQGEQGGEIPAEPDSGLGSLEDLGAVAPE
jgi:hypothetical protein